MALNAQQRQQLAREHKVSDAAIEAVERALGPNPLDSVQPRSHEVLKKVAEKGENLYREARDAEMTVSAYLEQMDPSNRYNDGLDAYERLLMHLGIRTKSIPELGIAADTVEKFCQLGKGSPSRGEVAGGDRFYMTDQPASIILFPEFINRQVRVQGQILPSILSDLVALVTPINSAVYDSFYLNLDATQLSLRRTGEAAPFPTAEMTGSSHTIRLKKYGRALRGTYEVYRRMSLDRFAFHLQQMAIQAAVDKSQAALDIIINGDGNPNTAATNYTQTALQGGGPTDPLSPKGWLTFNLKFRDPYRITTIIGTDANIISLLLMNMGTFNLPFAQFQNLQAGLGGGFALPEPVNTTNTPIRMYARSFAPTSSLVAIDNTRALEMVTEMGADLVETDKIIQLQFNEIVISEVVGWATLDSLANKTLQLGA